MLHRNKLKSQEFKGMSAGPKVDSSVCFGLPKVSPMEHLVEKIQRKRYSSYLFALLLASPCLLSAVDVTWVGGTSDWNTAGNWNPAVVPNMPGDIARFTGAGSTTADFASTTVSLGQLFLSGANYQIISSAGDGSFIFDNGASPAATTITSNTQVLLTGPSVGAGATNPILLSSPLTITNSSGNPFTMMIVDGTENLTMAQGTLDFTLANSVPSYSGVLVINGGATITGAPGPAGPIGAIFGGAEGSGSLDLTNFQGTVQLNVGASVVLNLSGSLIGGDSAIIEKAGPGTQILSGANDFSGRELHLSGGIVSVSSASNLNNVNSIHGNGGTLQVTDSFTLARPFLSDTTVTVSVDPGKTLTSITHGNQGPGSIIKSGGGTWDLAVSDANPVADYQVDGGQLLINATINSGATVNNGGTLNVIGTVSSASTVNSGGTLIGTGTLHGLLTINSGGTIRPGNSIGNINVDSITLNAGSVFQVEISPTLASQIVVANTATLLSNTIDVVADPGSYGQMGSLTILTAGNPLVGTPNPTVQGGLSGYTFTLFQTLNDLILNWFLTSPTPPTPGSGPIQLTGITGRARSFGKYLNKNAPNSEAALTLSHLTGPTLQKALESASPSRNAFAPFAAQDTMFAWNQLLAGHLVNQRFYHSQAHEDSSTASFFDECRDMLTADASGVQVFRSASTCNTHSVWIGTLGKYAHLNALDQNPAFHYWAGGGLLGIDFYNDKNLFGFGGGAAYTRLIENQDGGNVKVASYFATLYDTVYGPCDFPAYYEFAVWGVYNQIHNERHISFPGTNVVATASFHGWQLVPHLGLGYHADYGCVSFDPFAQFDIAVDWQQHFKETGAGAFNMTEKGRTSQFLRSEGGFRIYQTRNTCWGSWVFMEKVSYVNKKTFGTGTTLASIVGTSALFDVEIFRGTQNLGAYGLELLYRWEHNHPITASLSYNGEFGSQYRTQEILFRFMYDF